MGYPFALQIEQIDLKFNPKVQLWEMLSAQGRNSIGG
jgi:hypothetical protein